MEKTLAEIIKTRDIVHRKQKIFDIQKNKVIGYESLNRGPKGSPFANPLVLIEHAKQQDLLWEFEKIARTKTFQNLKHIQPHHKLFINVEPELVEASNFSEGYTMDLVEAVGLDPANIVFEITERAAIKNMDKFMKIINHYRKQNYLIAVDDVGTGYSGLTKIIQLEPDIIKLDLELIRDLETHRYKKAIVKAFKTLSEELNIMIIAEGIETQQELDVLKALGITHGQGYFLHKPQIASELDYKTYSLKLDNIK
jgi:EAL domain-containing protein (putative c-di-GMP-specific phosphodiesterase class I)